VEVTRGNSRARANRAWILIAFFDTDRPKLTPEGARVVAEAAEAYQETGAARD
jgi:hypothetical protein